MKMQSSDTTTITLKIKLERVESVHDELLTQLWLLEPKRAPYGQVRMFALFVRWSVNWDSKRVFEL
jgi:hypothetical protein